MSAEKDAISLDEERKRRKNKTPPPGKQDDARPVIRVRPGEINHTVVQAGTALADFNDGLYKHGPIIVRPIWDKVKMAGGTTGDALRFHAVPNIHIVERMTAAARWEKYDKRSEEWMPCNCPKDVADMYVGKGYWKDLPFILGITTTPTLRPDGTILDQEGYDPITGILYNALGVEFPEIPSHPTKEQALVALDFIKGPLRLFPFSPVSHISIALSAILSTLVRRTLPTVPMHAFSATAAGSGKSMLVDIASMIATGRRASVMSSGGTNPGDGEMEKRLGASMLAGDAIISIDNIEAPLGGDLLCQLLTQTVAKIRILGKTERVDVPVAASFFATGNNLSVVGDLTRRVLVGIISVDDERPELRSFPFNPINMVEDQRPSYVAAALTIMRAYIMSEDTVDVVPLGSFEEWSKMVREPLIWLGEADPVSVLDDVRKSDPRLQRLKAVMDAWSKTFGPGPQRVRDVVSAALENEYEHGTGPRNPDLREAVAAVSGGEGKFINAEKLSWWLRKNVGRVVGNMRFIRNEDQQLLRWELSGAAALEPVTESSIVTSSEQDIPF